MFLGFPVTPDGRVFAEMFQASVKGPVPQLYKLDRSTNRWISLSVRQDKHGNFERLQGNDGESLVFSRLIDKAELKLQIIDPSQMTRH